jgi:hypothetical protein
MEYRLGGREADALLGRASRIGAAAEDLVAFCDQDPELASLAGIEVPALEARSLLASGLVGSVSVRCSEAVRSGRPCSVSSSELDAVSRLEAVVATGAARVSQRIAALQAAEDKAIQDKVANVVSVGTGIFALVKTLGIV